MDLTTSTTFFLFLFATIFLISLLVHSFIETSQISRNRIVLKKGGTLVHKNIQLANLSVDDLNKICLKSQVDKVEDNLDVYYLSNGDIEIVSTAA